MNDLVDDAMPTPSEAEIQEKIDSGNYWIIEALSGDWIVVISKILRDFYKPKEEGNKPKGEIYVIVGGSSVMVLLEKKALPVADLASRLGSTVEAVSASTYIKLWPMDQDPAPKEPTVNYVGTA